MEVNNKSPINDIAIVEDSEEKIPWGLPGHLLHQLFRFLLRFPSSKTHLEACRDFSAGVKHLLKKDGRLHWDLFYRVQSKKLEEVDVIKMT